MESPGPRRSWQRPIFGCSSSIAPTSGDYWKRLRTSSGGFSRSCHVACDVSNRRYRRYSTARIRPDAGRRNGRRSPNGSARPTTPCHVSFPWYNTEHHHSGFGLLTPADVHHGLAKQRIAARATMFATAYAAHPERFPGGLPQPPACPTEVWINPPNTLVRSHAASNAQLSDLPTRTPSRSLPSIVTRS